MPLDFPCGTICSGTPRNRRSCGGPVVNEPSSRVSPAAALGRAAYAANRARFPQEELLRHAGRWVAFSRDGSRIVDSHATLEGLEDQLRAAGREPQDYVYESVAADDWIRSAAEFSS